MCASVGSRSASYSPLPIVPSSCSMWCSVIGLPRMVVLLGLIDLEQPCLSRSSPLPPLGSAVLCLRCYIRFCCWRALVLAFVHRSFHMSAINLPWPGCHEQHLLSCSP